MASTANIPHSITLHFHLTLFLWAGGKRTKDNGGFAGSDEALQPLKGRFMTAGFKSCWSENGELKEKYTPAFGVCAALWGQQLKRFGELHHLKAKGDVTKALE